MGELERQTTGISAEPQPIWNLCRFEPAKGWTNSTTKNRKWKLKNTKTVPNQRMETSEMGTTPNSSPSPNWSWFWIKTIPIATCWLLNHLVLERPNRRHILNHNTLTLPKTKNNNYEARETVNDEALAALANSPGSDLSSGGETREFRARKWLERVDTPQPAVMSTLKCQVTTSFDDWGVDWSLLCLGGIHGHATANSEPDLFSL